MGISTRPTDGIYDFMPISTGDHRAVKFDAAANLWEGTQPKPADVVQGDIGSCPILASLSAIALTPQGPDFLRDHVEEERDSKGTPTGKVTGTLYREDRHAVRLRTHKAACRSRAERASEAPVRSRLWVSMYEIFSAAFGLDGEAGYSFAPDQARLHRVDGAKANNALRCFLGAPCDEHPVNAPDLFTLDTHLFSANIDLDLQLLMSAQGAPDPDYEAVVDRWFQSSANRQRWYQHQSAIAAGWQDLLRWGNGRQITLDSFGNFLRRHVDRFSPDLGRALWDKVSGQGILPGRWFSGVYSSAQLDAFNFIDARVNGGFPTVATTRQNLGPPQTQGLAGDDMVSGLVAGHSYAVWRVWRGSVNGDPRHFVQIINPWGTYVRGYREATPELFEPAAMRHGGRWRNHGGGVFWIELGDFAQCFHIVIASQKSLQ